MRMMRRLAALIAVITVLGSCQLAVLFSLSPFPTELSRVSARADLSGSVPQTYPGSFSLSAVVMNDGTELVILANASTYTGTHVLVMDSSLKLTQTLSDTDLSGALSAATAIADAAVPQKISIGDRTFTVSGARLGGVTAKPSAGPFSGSWAALAPVNLNGAVDISGNTISNYVYDGGWNSMSSQAGPISSIADSFTLARLFSDTSRTSTVLALRKLSTDEVDVLEIPWLDMTNAFWPSGVIIPQYQAFTLTCKWSGLLGYARGVFVSYRETSSNNSGGELYCTDLTGTELAGTLRFDHSFNTESQLSVSPTGRYVYVFDPETRVISRLNGWWPL
jgi:hypothetical protein